MKNIAESEETFMAYSMIDASYYLFEQLVKKINAPKSNLVRMIDKQTGFDKAEVEIWAKEAKDLLQVIIEQKKIIEADYTKDETTLNELIDKYGI